MKEKTKQFYQTLLDFLNDLLKRYPVIAIMLAGSFSIGFVLVAVGVMINLASTESILKIISFIK